jgi:hypothetical protein
MTTANSYTGYSGTTPFMTLLSQLMNPYGAQATTNAGSAGNKSGGAGTVISALANALGGMKQSNGISNPVNTIPLNSQQATGMNPNTGIMGSVPQAEMGNPATNVSMQMSGMGGGAGGMLARQLPPGFLNFFKNMSKEQKIAWFKGQGVSA